MEKIPKNSCYIFLFFQSSTLQKGLSGSEGICFLFCSFSSSCWKLLGCIVISMKTVNVPSLMLCCHLFKDEAEVLCSNSIKDLL